MMRQVIMLMMKMLKVLGMLMTSARAAAAGFWYDLKLKLGMDVVAKVGSCLDDVGRRCTLLSGMLYFDFLISIVDEDLTGRPTAKLSCRDWIGISIFLGKYHWCVGMGE